MNNVKGGHLYLY